MVLCVMEEEEEENVTLMMMMRDLGKHETEHERASERETENRAREIGERRQKTEREQTR